MESLKGKGSKAIDLNTLEEGDAGESKASEGDRSLLQGFREANVKIHLIGEKDLKKLSQKGKYKALFDLGVFSVHSAGDISEPVTTLFKDRARIHCETADSLVIMNAEQRGEFRKKILEKTGEAGWLQNNKAPYKHHMLFEVVNPRAKEDQAKREAEEDSDDLDLADL